MSPRVALKGSETPSRSHEQVPVCPLAFGCADLQLLPSPEGLVNIGLQPVEVHDQLHTHNRCPQKPTPDSPDCSKLATRASIEGALLTPAPMQETRLQPVEVTPAHLLPPHVGPSSGASQESGPPGTRNQPDLGGTLTSHSPRLIPQRRRTTGEVTTAIPSPLESAPHTELQPVEVERAILLMNAAQGGDRSRTVAGISQNFNRLKLAAWAGPASTLPPQASIPS